MTTDLDSMAAFSSRSFRIAFLLLTLFFAPGQAQDIVRTTVIVVTVGSTATPTVPQPPSYTSLDVFKDDVLSASNAYRRAHNATNLLWNETLTTYARDWAEQCKWKHSVGSPLSPAPVPLVPH